MRFFFMPMSYGGSVRAAKPPVKAKDLFPDAKDNQTLVGANSAGAVAFDGNERITLLWSRSKPDAFFKQKVVPDRVLFSTEVDDNLVLAALAIELAQPMKVSRNFQDNVRSLITDPDAADEKLKLLFGK